LLTDETGRDIARAVTRLSYAVEAHNRIQACSGEPSEPPYGPTLYTESLPVRIPRLPGNSWHERLRAKRVSLPAATGWSLLGLALTELVRLLLANH
jgi:hypothetical protein